MVRGGVDRRETISASRETGGDIRGEDTVLGGVVQTFEEGKVRGVGRLRGGEGVDGFDDNVRVALDVAATADLLGRGEEVFIRVDEVAGVEVRDGHLDGERLVLLDDGAVGWEDELRRGHVRRRGDDTHGSRVARAGLNLLTVGDREVGDGQAKVNEVVGRGEGGDLAGSGYILTVVLEACGDNLRVESWVMVSGECDNSGELAYSGSSAGHCC